MDKFKFEKYWFITLSYRGLFDLHNNFRQAVHGGVKKFLVQLGRELLFFSY